MTKPNRRRSQGAALTPADQAVDPRDAPGSYLKNGDGTFTRTDEAPGEQAATAVAIPAGSAQAMLDAFADLGVEAPEHLVVAAGAPVAPSADEEDDEEEEAAPGEMPAPTADPEQNA